MGPRYSNKYFPNKSFGLLKCNSKFEEHRTMLLKRKFCINQVQINVSKQASEHFDIRMTRYPDKMSCLNIRTKRESGYLVCMTIQI